MTFGETLGIVAAILTPILGVLTLLVNRLRERDKLQFDIEMKVCKDAVSRCETDCKEARDSVSADRQKREIAELKAARIEGELVSLNRENQNLREENRELRDRFMGNHNASPDKHGNG